MLRTRGQVSFDTRSTFVIDADGNVAAVFPEVEIDGHIAEVLEAVKKL